MLPTRTQGHQYLAGGGNQIGRNLFVKNLRGHALRCARIQAKLRVAGLTEIERSAGKRSVSGEHVEDGFSSPRSPLDLLKVVDEIGEPADERRHVGARILWPVAGRRSRVGAVADLTCHL